jgi:hypothetical protein
MGAPPGALLMPMQTVRPVTRDFREPVDHELDPIRCAGQLVNLFLVLRCADDGAWRARLRFVDPDSSQTRETAEIFCSLSEAELWASVRGLRDHHLRDLYRSLD